MDGYVIHVWIKKGRKRMDEKTKQFISNINESYQEIIDSYLIEKISMNRGDLKALAKFVLNFASDNGKLDYKQGAATSEHDPEMEALAKKGLVKKRKEKDHKGSYTSYTLTKNGGAVALQMIQKGEMKYYRGDGSGAISWKSMYGDKIPKV